MSKYGIDKFMRVVNMDREALAAYVAAPEAFVAAWTGGHLTEEEQQALAQRDYESLYASGAHPYLLWSFAEAVWVPEISRPELVERYRVAARRHGYPDFST